LEYDLLAVTLNPSLDREFVIENFESGNLFRINNPSNSDMEPGGKGINVSLMTSDLGVSSINMGFLGGFIGNVLQTKLSIVKNITTNFVYCTEETRENIEIIDPVKNTITEINSMGPFINEDDLTHFMKRYKSVTSLVDHVLVSGSIPPGLPITIYSDLFSYAIKQGKTTYMEANGPHFDEAIRNNCPMVVKPDLRKSTRVLGHNLETVEDYLEVGQSIIDYGARLVIMSYHVVGDMIFTKDGAWLFTPTDEIERSHLFGAGDAFISGIVTYLIKKGYDYFEAAKFGMSAAISSTNYIGKILGAEEEIEICKSKFKIERLK